MFRALLGLTLARVFRCKREKANAQANRIIVRYLLPVMVVAAVAVTILHTHFWIHLGLFPLLWLAVELEYRISRESELPCVA